MHELLQNPNNRKSSVFVNGLPVFEPRVAWRSFLRTLGRSTPLYALVFTCACGPEKKALAPKDHSADSSANEKGDEPSDHAQGQSKNADLASNLEGALALRSFDLEEADRQSSVNGKKQVVLAASERTCDDLSKRDLGITTVFKKWTGTLGNVTFIDSAGFPNTRLESWIRPKPIFCSVEQWAKVGWQRAQNLEGLEQRVIVQLATSQLSGNRTTESLTYGQRTYQYDAAGFQLADKSIRFRRKVIIGSESLPTTVRVILKENGTEIRSTSGDVFTDPANPIVEVITRSCSNSCGGDGEDDEGNTAPVTLAKTVESGVVFAKQADGTTMKTTLNNLVYLGRKSDGSFSCIPTSGTVTDEVTFSPKTSITVKRDASPSGTVVSTQCSAGLSLEQCAVLVQKAIRRTLTPYCLY